MLCGTYNHHDGEPLKYLEYLKIMIIPSLLVNNRNSYWMLLLLLFFISSRNKHRSVADALESSTVIEYGI